MDENELLTAFSTYEAVFAFTALFAHEAVPNNEPVIDPETLRDPVRYKLLSFNKVKLPLPLKTPPLLNCKEYIGPFGVPLPLLATTAFTVTIPVPPAGDKVTFVPATSWVTPPLLA